MVSGRTKVLDTAMIQSGWWANIGQVKLGDYGEILNCPIAAELQGTQTVTPTAQSLADIIFSTCLKNIGIPYCCQYQQGWCEQKAPERRWWRKEYNKPDRASNLYSGASVGGSSSQAELGQQKTNGAQEEA